MIDISANATDFFFQPFVVLRECVRQQLRRVWKDHWNRLKRPLIQREALARGLLPLQQVQDQPCGQAVRQQGGQVRHRQWKIQIKLWNGSDPLENT